METGQRYSPIADSFASRLKWISGRPPREHVTIGFILLVFGVVAFGISPDFSQADKTWLARVFSTGSSSAGVFGRLSMSQGAVRTA